LVDQTKRWTDRKMDEKIDRGYRDKKKITFIDKKKIVDRKMNKWRVQRRRVA